MRLKNGMRSRFWLPSPATSKTPAPSRKNVLFSGKNSSNRVRLIWRESTSVSAKSVLTVSDAVRLEVIALKTSAPSLALPRPFSSPPDRKGRTSSPRPCLASPRPRSCPAAARLAIQTSRPGLAQRSFSWRRLIERSTLSPHTSCPGLKRRVLKGIAISAIHPSVVIRVRACQMPSHSLLSSWALFEICPSVRAPAGFTSKKKPFRWSKYGSSTMRTWSSTSRWASRASCVVTIAEGVRS